MPPKDTAQFFDRYAADFESIYGTRNSFFANLLNKYFRKSMRLRFEMTISGCTPSAGKSVVDIGCGTGQFSIRLAQNGVKSVFGIDFAQGMIKIARQNAANYGVSNICRFETADFLKYDFPEKYNYAILMGFMDYVENAREVIKKTLSITEERAFFSFPIKKGFLAWQRKIRYRNRCELYMYNLDMINSLFSDIPNIKLDIKKIARDYFVTVTKIT
jgi:2-polyprenyl-3-methyl-5-hydroxy-6-metoxy-1,4-benzoquinol methylase